MSYELRGGSSTEAGRAGGWTGERATRRLGRACLLALSVLFLATGAGGQAWIELGPAPIRSGPFTGRCSAVVASPVDPARLFIAGGSGGVWRSLDGGSSWSPLTDFLPTTAIGALALDPSDEQVLYAGSGEANYAHHCFYGEGLFKTTDGGDTWSVLAADRFAGRSFARLLVSPADPETLYAAVMHAGGFPARGSAKGHPLRDDPVGVYRSRDGGASWELLTGLPAVAASDLAFQPGSPEVLFAAIGDPFGSPANGIYKSIDGGDSWTRLAGGALPADPGRIALAVSAAAPLRVYALVTQPADAGGGSAATRGLYRSDDGGLGWIDRSPGNLQASYGWYVCALGADPGNADLVYAGGVPLVRSIDGGASWETVTPPHVDIQALAHDAAGRLLCANDGGIHRSASRGDAWIDLNEGLGTAQPYPGISLHPTDPDFVLAGLQDNGTNRREGGRDWTMRIGGDGGYTALHPASPEIVWGEYQGSGNVFFSPDRAQSFEFRGNGIDRFEPNCFLPPIVFSPDDPSRLYTATNRIYRTDDLGLAWTPISADLTGGAGAAVRALVFAPSDPLVAYAATNDGRVSVSLDGGASWRVRLTGMPGWPRVTRELAVDPLDADVALLGVSRFDTDQVLRTQDRGETWEAIDWNLPDLPVNTVAIHRMGGRRLLFAGTDRGVQAAWEDESRWRAYGSGLPNAPVNDLVVDPGFSRLVAATMGRGLWSLALPGPETGNCANGDDDDFDGAVDCADEDCLPDPACAEADFDGDGQPNAEDCAPRDPGAFAVPPEVPRLDLRLDLPGSEPLLSWTDVSAASGSGTRHELAGDLLASLWAARTAEGACFQRDLPGTAHVDRRPPAGSVYYLVRAVNACGPASSERWGRDSSGSARPACP